MVKIRSMGRLAKLIVSILVIYATIFIFYYSLVCVSRGAYFRYNWTWVGSSVLSRQQKGRILCAVMTIPANHKSKAAAVLGTWSKRCDSTVFFTSSEDPNVFASSSVVVINVTQGRNFLWEKTRTAFLHMQQYYGDSFDWFLKSDDDTYFVIENLRSFLSEYNPNDRLWFGCVFVHHTTKVRFPSGGAGYVLSRGAIQAFAETVYKETENSTELSTGSNSLRPIGGCGLDGGSMGEDVRFSLCLESAGVKLIDAQGPSGTYRFLPTMLEHFVFPERNGGNGWITMYRKKLGQGIEECCDERLISIHYADPKLMHVYEFLIYHLKLADAVAIR